jgi:farnesyl diphosphate synthase
MLIRYTYRHQLIVIYKTSYYSFYLPVALGLLMCGFPASETASFSVEQYNARAGQKQEASSDPFQLALDILIPLGEYFQVQDDFLDYSGTPEQIGKIGTDILDNKCSWCVNTALKLATPEQRKVLDENYGRKDAEKEARIKQLYEELDIRSHYEKYEAEAYEKIMGLIETIPEQAGEGQLKREVFTSFLFKIYKRQK